MKATTDLICGPVGNIRAAAVSPRCDFMAWLTNPAYQLSIRHLQSNSRSVKEESLGSGVQTFAFRQYLADGDKMVYATELLYSAAGSNQIARYCLRSGKVIGKTLLGVPGHDTTRIEASSDGRYVAAGNTVGEVAVHNYDRSQATLVSHGRICSSGVRALGFHRTNTRLYVASQDGELFELDIMRDARTLLGRSKSWRCNTIAGHPNGEGIVFGGTGRRIWLLGLPGEVGSVPDDPESAPIAIAHKRNVGGGRFWCPAAMPHARLRYIDTGVGKFVRQLSFNRQGQLVVVGESRVEVWELGRKSRVVARNYSGEPVLVTCFAAASHNGKTVVAWDEERCSGR